MENTAIGLSQPMTALGRTLSLAQTIGWYVFFIATFVGIVCLVWWIFARHSSHSGRLKKILIICISLSLGALVICFVATYTELRLPYDQKYKVTDMRPGQI